MTIESKDVLSMWTIYDKPTDYPAKIVARRWEILPGNPDPVSTNDVILSDTLERMQFSMGQKGLSWLPRDPNDDPKIVGVWL